MSYYYEHTFISPESSYAVVREELKSYFDTGVIDDLMFPTYLNKCLEKLGKTSYVIAQEVLHVEDFQSRLPDNFNAVREAWLCVEIPLVSYQTPNSFYSQTMTTTIQIAPLTIGGKECNCNNENCEDPQCEGRCTPDIIQSVYKTNHEVPRTFRREFLLKPGNISAKSYCDVNYTSHYNEYMHKQPVSLNSSAYDSFDIRDNKFVTNFRGGTVYLIFYATNYDDIGNQLIPDNYRVKEFVEAFLKYKMFETTLNQTMDETFNQLMQKLQYYKALSDEAFILADIEIKKQTVHQKQRAIKQTLRRNSRFELPNAGRGRRSVWRRGT